jgi:hypothetical protein
MSLYYADSSRGSGHGKQSYAAFAVIVGVSVRPAHSETAALQSRPLQVSFFLRKPLRFHHRGATPTGQWSTGVASFFASSSPWGRVLHPKRLRRYSARQHVLASPKIAPIDLAGAIKVGHTPAKPLVASTKASTEWWRISCLLS